MNLINNIKYISKLEKIYITCIWLKYIGNDDKIEDDKNDDNIEDDKDDDKEDDNDYDPSTRNEIYKIIYNLPNIKLLSYNDNSIDVYKISIKIIFR